MGVLLSNNTLTSGKRIKLFVLCSEQQAALVSYGQASWPSNQIAHLFIWRLAMPLDPFSASGTIALCLS